VHDAPPLEPDPRNERTFDFLDAVGPAPAGRSRNPYMEAGHHPDMVERVWDKLGAALPESCTFLVRGNPVLAHPRTLAVFALPRGTAYALWLTPDDRDGCDLSTVHRWGSGSATDLAERLGDGWFWGRFDPRETGWCRAAFDWWDRA
jgi:hypothetical protein